MSNPPISGRDERVSPQELEEIIKDNISCMLQEGAAILRQGVTDVLVVDQETGLRALSGDEIVQGEYLVNDVDRAILDFLTQAYKYPTGLFITVGRTRDLQEKNPTDSLWLGLAKSLLGDNAQFRQSFVENIRRGNTPQIQASMIHSFKDWIWRDIVYGQVQQVKAYDLEPINNIAQMLLEERHGFDAISFWVKRLFLQDEFGLGIRQQYEEIPPEYDFTSFLVQELSRVSVLDNETVTSLTCNVLDYLTGQYLGYVFQSPDTVKQARRFVQSLIELIIQDLVARGHLTESKLAESHNL